MSRTMAADDYSFIQKRMQEIKSSPVISNVTTVEIIKTDCQDEQIGVMVNGMWYIKDPSIEKLTQEEMDIVGKRFGCIRGTIKNSCGANISRTCEDQGKCRHKK